MTSVTSDAWQRNAERLAEFTWKYLTPKKDRYGDYSPDGGAKWSHNELTKEKLIQHFRGQCALGAGTTGLEDECLWVCIDLDNHQKTDPFRPMEIRMVADSIADDLRRLGFHPLIEDSDGRGGIHVWVIFSTPVPAARAFRFGQWIIRQNLHLPRHERPEAFPKQPTIQHTSAKCGNYVRLPGKHHKQNHWSRFLGDDGEWLDPDSSVQLLLNHRGDAPDLIPTDLPPLPEKKSASDSLPELSPEEFESRFGITLEMAERQARLYLFGNGRPDGIENRHTAIEGQRGDDQTFHVASLLIEGYALPFDRAVEVLFDWNEHCVPPWEPEGLERKLSESQRKADPERLGHALNPDSPYYRIPAGDEFAGIDLGLNPGERPEFEWKPFNAWEAIQRPQPRAEVLIDGLLRRGEVGNIVASTKIGKSWLALLMAFCVSAGQPWLGRKITQGRVLLIDNELRSSEIQNRLAEVAGASGLKASPEFEPFDVLPLRGRFTGIPTLIREMLNRYQPGELALIVFDAKYRFFAELDENSNSDQARFHNLIDQLATELNCGIVLVHHATKGDQSGKATTDIGSGGGAQSRAVDCHLVIRPHDAGPEHFVLDASVRSFPPVQPQTLKWKFPVWSLEDSMEPILKSEPTRGDVRQVARDRKALSELARKFPEPDSEFTRYEVRERTGWNAERVKRLLGIGVELRITERCGFRDSKNGRQAELYRFRNEFHGVNSTSGGNHLNGTF